MAKDEFLQRRQKVYDMLMESANKNGIEVHYSRDIPEPSPEERVEMAERIREGYLHPSTHIERVNRRGLKDQDMKAYEMMTSEEILMTEERESEYTRREIQDFLVRLRKAEVVARKKRIIVRAKIPA
jgi:hypothetical protein